MPYAVDNQPASPANSSLPPSTPPAPLQNVPTAIVSKPKKRFAFFLIFIAVVFLLSLVFFFTQSQKPLTNVAAVVNGKPIPKKNYDAALKSSLNFLSQTYPKITSQKVLDNLLKSQPKLIADNLIQEALLTDYLEKKGIIITDEQVKQSTKEKVVDKFYSGSWENYQKDLNSKGISLETALNNGRLDLLKSKVAELEHLTSSNFDSWYYQLKTNSKIINYVSSQ